MALAAQQYGVVIIDQLLALGVTRRWIDNLVRRGVLRRRGVYVVCGSVETWRQRAMVGLLALGEKSWVSHEAAAVLHGAGPGRTRRRRVHRAAPGPERSHAVRAAQAHHRLACRSWTG
jgi:hypothetical protein